MTDLKLNLAQQPKLTSISDEKIFQNFQKTNQSPKLDTLSSDAVQINKRVNGNLWGSASNIKFSDNNRISSRSVQNNLPTTIPVDSELQKALDANTTEGIKKGNRPESLKGTLEPTLKILEMYDPKAVEWLKGRKEHEYALAGDTIKVLRQDIEIYAAWTAIAREGAKIHINDMVLGNHFWELPDVDKASTLYHEYTHAVDNPFSRQANKLYGTVDNLIHKTYGDKAEDKAYIAQWKMMKAFGRDDGLMYEEVKSYLEDRKFDLSKI